MQNWSYPDLFCVKFDPPSTIWVPHACVLCCGSKLLHESVEMQQDKIEASGDLLDKAYIYLTEGRYPNGCKGNEKRVIRRKAAKFVTRDGELLYKKTVRRLGGKKVCILDHVERTDPARYHFRKPYKCPRCHARGHALCHAPKMHTHLHEGLLDVVIRIARQ